MRDSVIVPAIVVIAQAGLTVGDQPWEKFTISTLSIAVTIFIWRYFTAREAASARELNEARKKQEEIDMAERNRLLGIQNELQQQVVDLLKRQKISTDEVAKLLLHKPVHAVIENDVSKPIPIKPIQ